MIPVLKYYFFDTLIDTFSMLCYFCIGLYSMHASYSDITNIKKSVVGPLLPFGITITAKTENGKSKNYKFSLLNRAKWLDYLAEKTGLSYS